jgi:hypothetical protein
MASRIKEMTHTKTNGCGGNCNQGRQCDCCPNAYRKNFDHFGNPIEQEPPFLLTDLIIIAIAVIGTAVLLAGVV